MHLFWTRGAQDLYTTHTYSVNINGTLVNLTETTSKVETCGYPTPAYEDFENFVRPWIALVLTNIIPCILISIFNVFIVRAMIQMKKAPAIQDKEMEKRNRNVFQTAAMCLAGSISFLVCITPTIVLTVGKIHWATYSNQGYDIAKAFNNVFFYVNYSINFFLYCLTGGRFRNTFLQLFVRAELAPKTPNVYNVEIVPRNCPTPNRFINCGLRGRSREENMVAERMSVCMPPNMDFEDLSAHKYSSKIANGSSLTLGNVFGIRRNDMKRSIAYNACIHDAGN